MGNQLWTDVTEKENVLFGFEFPLNERGGIDE